MTNESTPDYDALSRDPRLPEYLRAFPLPPRRVLIAAAMALERVRDDTRDKLRRDCSTLEAERDALADEVRRLTRELQHYRFTDHQLGYRAPAYWTSQREIDLRAKVAALESDKATAVEAAFAEGVLVAARSTEAVEHGLACWPASKAKARLEGR